MKPIETIYNSYRFRSRLEARWAVFFDTLDIPYEYEKEGFDLEGIWYLPDFWLPQQQCWIEIKGQQPEEELHEKGGTWYKAGLLSRETKKPVHVLAGDVWSTTVGVSFFPFNESHPVFQLEVLETIIKACGTILAVPPSREGEDACHRIRTSGASTYEQVRALFTLLQSGVCSFVSLFRGTDPVAWITFISYGYLAVNPVRWSECYFCGAVSLFWSILDFSPACSCEHVAHATTSDRINAAFQAARQARFEYGDSKTHFRVPGFDQAKNEHKIVYPQEPHATAQEEASAFDRQYFEEHPSETVYKRLSIEGEFPSQALSSLQDEKEKMLKDFGLREDEVDFVLEVEVTQVQVGFRQRRVHQLIALPLTPEAAEKMDEGFRSPQGQAYAHVHLSQREEPQGSNATSSQPLTNKARKKAEKRKRRRG